MNDLFHRLKIGLRQLNNLRAADVLQIKKHPIKSNNTYAEEELIQTFLEKLLMMNYRARYIKAKENNEQDQTQQEYHDVLEDECEICDDFLENISMSDSSSSESKKIHPMDVQMAAFHCADGFLKQLMVTKLSQCQFALPLLVPDPFTRQIEFPLWTFRQITKSWNVGESKNETVGQTQPIYKAQTPMVFFFRFGSLSSSKSQLINSLINEKHNTFFHRNCPGSSRSRVLMDGVVEIAWFCPSGKNTDKFTDCVAFCNLHGDAGANEKQWKILTEMASVNVVLLQQHDKNDRITAKIQKLYSEEKPLICLFTDHGFRVTKKKTGKYNIGLKGRNQSDVSKELRKAINDCLSESSLTFRLEDVSKHSDLNTHIKVDEKDDEDCRKGRAAAQQMMSLLEEKELTEIKESVLPHQGELWHQWCRKNKELYRLQADEMKIKNEIEIEIENIRQNQYESKISDFMVLFLKKIYSHDKHKIFFLKWLSILLDEHTAADLSALRYTYNEKWSTVLKLKENHEKSQLKYEQTELERISEDLQAAAFGLEHIMREIGQIYESCLSVKKNKKDLPVDFSSLPSLAAEMMISGFPLELMDGDAPHVPVVWISAVFDQLVQKLGDQRIFVLSVLGIQSSGKSTMLNAMFGLQFAVSAGRCTRGAFMQLVKVSDEMKTQMNCDYILVVDTEGLRALELAGRSTKHHDNELATFVVGLANLTLINIFGENPSEMQDILQIIVQAFLRMKKVRLNPSCVFVHQNVSDIAAVERTMEGRRRLLETLDEMTKLAAEEEVCEVERFSDVITFDIQKDVKYFAQLWEGSPPMAPPNPDYCENIQDLKETIISHVSKLDGMMLNNLKDQIKNLWEALLNEQFVLSFKNSLEAGAYNKLQTKYTKWSNSLHIAMQKTENNLLKQIESEAIHEVEETDFYRELMRTTGKVQNSMSAFFERDAYANILNQWKASYEKNIKEFLEITVKEKTKKLKDALLERDLEKKFDAQRTNLQQILYERSQQLALKYKDKANDEGTLETAFDWFWNQCIESITDIDILRDVRKFIVDCNDYDYNIFTVNSYSTFVTYTEDSKRGTTGVSNQYDETISPQIRSLIKNIDQQTKKLIESFNISKTGYNIRHVQQLCDYIIMRIQDHQKGQVQYQFKDDFFVKLVYSICKNINDSIIKEHRKFMEANYPVLYLESKRLEYYEMFRKYCHAATSTVMCGESICQELKEPIEQIVYKKTARNLAYEITKNCETLKGNRSVLEKHILKALAEEEDFDKYMNYINNPRDHFERFVKDEVNWYITEKFSISLTPRMKEYIKLLQENIMKAAHESSEHGGDFDGLWLKNFIQQLSGQLDLSEKQLRGVKHDVDDFKFLEKVIRQELTAVMSDISRRFNIETFRIKLEPKFRPDELLIKHFSQSCWSQCPFCKAICTNPLKKHGDHSSAFHCVQGVSGHTYTKTTNLSTSICTSAVTDDYFFPLDPADCITDICRHYRTVGGVCSVWSIPVDLSELPYWKWFVCRFQKDLENYHNKTFEGLGEIPDEWRKYSKQDAIESLYHFM